MLLQTTQPTSSGAATTVPNCCANCVETSRIQKLGPHLPFFEKPAMRTRSLLHIKAGDVETNPGPTTTHKQVGICDICHKQIHSRKQISIMCNSIEHWVHLRCAGIHQEQNTDTWTCYLHRESGLTTHTDITSPHPSRSWSKPPTHSTPTPPTLPQRKHRHTSNTHR